MTSTMSITLTPAELIALTGYRRSSDQLRTLHQRGFWRAWVHPTAGLILERAHYNAVCAGQPTNPRAGRACT